MTCGGWEQEVYVGIQCLCGLQNFINLKACLVPKPSHQYRSNSHSREHRTKPAGPISTNNGSDSSLTIVSAQYIYVCISCPKDE